MLGSSLCGKTLLLAVGLLAIGSRVSAERENAPPESALSQEDQKEVMKAEAQLSAAITQHRAERLDELLASYYSDAFDGSEHARSKKGALGLCAAGNLHDYPIKQEQHFSRSMEIVTVEGIAPTPPSKNGERPKELFTHVRRLWTKQDGHWLVVSQILRPLEN